MTFMESFYLMMALHSLEPRNRKHQLVHLAEEHSGMTTISTAWTILVSENHQMKRRPLTMMMMLKSQQHKSKRINSP
jgi:hypothetical protein